MSLIAIRTDEADKYQNYTTGRLVLDVSQIKTSKIVFQYSHRPIQGQIEAPAVLRSRTITAAVHVRAARMFIEQSATGMSKNQVACCL